MEIDIINIINNRIMDRILRKQRDYESPKSNLLKIELEGLLCASTDAIDLDGNHEGFGTIVDFSWTVKE